ncbi:NAD dependent epimerase/dehydratase family protein [Tenacibaculum sp. MAR_2009_124]|uniref:NAD-dependent epimerase/dehydratase family protein n=1 Tax=Tenacibaculum sp. MAR_2009_124 TaxID=1250059 RepID=UPI00089B512F|nr:NAD(P)-dependent oxidoreductase [Tenacibaculum sp. MAR_2009_124]SED22630.1 NAD dependent epimerase/dehydratase family protein [Tenacibaculum sp. MAR_2009_124]
MKKILITGGFGKIAKYFIQNFEHKYEITVVDIITSNGIFSDNVRVEKANLTDFSICSKLCEGIDTVIHLAGIVDPVSESDDILDTNIKITQNIFKAAVKAKCKRLIFASSAQTIESYPTDIQVNKNMLVKPKNIYGVSKCFGEALAAYYSYNRGISAICLRIGAYEFPEDFTEMNARDLSAFLHPDDFNQLLIGCIETKNLQYEVLNAISENRYKRLDISESKEKVGYRPKADAFELFKLSKEG